MAKILNDTELKKLVDKQIIVNGNYDSIRSNAYVLRLGAKGEYTHIGKEFDISKNKKKGFKLPTGNSVAIMSFEVLDFRRDTVQKLYKGCDLFAWMSPITDLSREGIITQTTQIDAGFHGVLNWTFNNTSNKENEFLYKENLYRLMIFKLEDGEEIPAQPYDGTYQNQEGIVRSKRQAAPRGMKESEWETPLNNKSPEKHLEHLINSGYPWSILGERLKTLDGQLVTITDEYSKIESSINALVQEVHTIPNAIDREIEVKKSKWLTNIGVIFSGFSAIAIGILTNNAAIEFLRDYGAFVSITILIITILIAWINNKKI